MQFQIDSDTKKAIESEASGGESIGNSYAVSTDFWRELAFVAHHGVHHMAVMKVICQNHGFELPENIGVAPSTRNAVDLFLMSSKIN